tara:strand:- start:313 stop:450 length:138 start_codon:yes stop_codon:yes gene_type:complete
MLMDERFGFFHNDIIFFLWFIDIEFRFSINRLTQTFRCKARRGKT